MPFSLRSVAEIDAIASHGQTVAHHPEHAASLQIASPSRIAERAGLPVVGDFRSRDLAAGGEGAPLAPFFHFAAFSEPGEARVALPLPAAVTMDEAWRPAYRLYRVGRDILWDFDLRARASDDDAERDGAPVRLT